MEHRDKQVRLYSVSACMELFTVYAPDAPWSTEETLEIFRQTIRQLANLAHTTSPTHPHYADYARILDLLAEVKIGVILVEMTKEEECREEALPVLAELFRTLLQSVRTEHPPEIAEMTQATICGCFEEFHDGIMLPIPLLDEILLCVGQGSRVLVVNPQKAAAQQQSSRKAHTKQLPAHQVEQANPSYIVASSVLRSTVDRLSTPIASLLNGLLNNDPRLVSESSISTQLIKELSKPQTQDQNAHADVFNIIYELHRVAPSILTTVVGTLTNFLAVPEVDQRKLVVQLLGKLFVKAPSRFANEFRLCYREWLERASDKDMSIRLSMVDDLLLLILPAATSTVVEDALDHVSQGAQSMLKRCLDDPASEVRLRTIHGLCDTAYRHPRAVSLDTWLAVGSKVTSKQKLERKHALTGLVQTYYHHYMAKRLKDVHAGGDDVPLEIVQVTLDAAESFDEKEDNDRVRLEWIPSRVFECASWKDDTDLQSRVWQAMDDMLLGSQLASSSKNLSSTARAVGLALLVDSLEDNALSWLGGMLRERSKLQQKLGEYMDARTLIREHPVGMYCDCIRSSLITTKVSSYLFILLRRLGGTFDS
jgi:sister-chromatid-cohesion protein PDS5